MALTTSFSAKPAIAIMPPIEQPKDADASHLNPRLVKQIECPDRENDAEFGGGNAEKGKAKHTPDARGQEHLGIYHHVRMDGC
jgi:hypothetical protein